MQEDNKTEYYIEKVETEKATYNMPPHRKYCN